MSSRFSNCRETHTHTHTWMDRGSRVADSHELLSEWVCLRPTRWCYTLVFKQNQKRCLQADVATSQTELGAPLGAPTFQRNEQGCSPDRSNSVINEILWRCKLRNAHFPHTHTHTYIFVGTRTHTHIFLAKHSLQHVSEVCSWASIGQQILFLGHALVIVGKHRGDFGKFRG